MKSLFKKPVFRYAGAGLVLIGCLVFFQATWGVFTTPNIPSPPKGISYPTNIVVNGNQEIGTVTYAVKPYDDRGNAVIFSVTIVDQAWSVEYVGQMLRSVDLPLVENNFTGFDVYTSIDLYKGSALMDRLDMAVNQTGTVTLTVVSHWG